MKKTVTLIAIVIVSVIAVGLVLNGQILNSNLNPTPTPLASNTPVSTTPGPTPMNGGTLKPTVNPASTSATTLPVPTPTTPPLNDTPWTKYSGNPILSPAIGSWDGADLEQPYVVYDLEGIRYAMFYEAKNDMVRADYQVGLAFSSDGVTNWVRSGSSPVLSFGASGQWDQQSVGGPAAIKVNGTWFLFYSGVSATFDGIGVASSSNIAGPYTRLNEGNPILSTKNGTWDGLGIYLGDVWIENGTWYMLYEGWSTYSPTWNFQIGLATSSDGLNWTKSSNNPVIKPTVNGWDSLAIGNPSVIVQDGVTYCFYDGTSDFYWAYGYVGIATSTDNVHWTKASGIVFDPAYYHGDRAESAPQVVRIGNQFNCYYCVYKSRSTDPGDDYEIAFAYSNDIFPTASPAVLSKTPIG